MWTAVELVFKHYEPDELEIGMLFINTLYPGNPSKEKLEVWELKEEDEELTPELMFIKNGFPVKPYLIDEDDNIIATPDEIGWFDAGSKYLSFIPFGIKEMNFIFEEFDGLLEILIDEYSLEEEEKIEAITEDNKVILRFLTDNYDEQF
jgi:hypothetical protein